MHPLVRAACVVAVIAALGSSAPREPRGAARAAAEGSAAPLASANGCPERAVAIEGGACVWLPDEKGTPQSARARRLGLLPPEEPELERETQMVPRLPERSERFADYQLPVDPVIAVDAPVDPTERARKPGIRIESDPGAPVHLVDLEGQKGRPEVVLVGQLHGVTVLVRHQVEAPSGARNYLAVYGNLDRPGPHVVNGARLSPLAVIGYIEDEDEARGTHLYFEVRQELAPLGRPAEHLSQLVSPGASVPVDPRNVLPLRK
jgi:hypothetical protein